MGATQSLPQQEIDDAVEVTNESGGLHLFELHAPTAGVGLGLLAMILAGGCLCIYCVRFVGRKCGVVGRGTNNCSSSNCNNNNNTEANGSAFPFGNLSGGGQHNGCNGVPMGSSISPQLMVQQQLIQSMMSSAAAAVRFNAPSAAVDIPSLRCDERILEALRHVSNPPTQSRFTVVDEFSPLTSTPSTSNESSLAYGEKEREAALRVQKKLNRKKAKESSTSATSAEWDEFEVKK
jgi:hypothetical protein